MKDLKHIKRFNEASENLNISDVSGSYFITNYDNQIHNLNDVLHNIIEHDGWKEISVIGEDGDEIDSCRLYNSLKELLTKISK